MDINETVPGKMGCTVSLNQIRDAFLWVFLIQLVVFFSSVMFSILVNIFSRFNLTAYSASSVVYGMQFSQIFNEEVIKCYISSIKGRNKKKSKLNCSRKK